MYPPKVSWASSGNSSESSSLTSLMGTPPHMRTIPSFRYWNGRGSSSSCSSCISPMISSIRSSRETSPAVPQQSSTTIAYSLNVCHISGNSNTKTYVVGTNWIGRMISDRFSIFLLCACHRSRPMSRPSISSTLPV